MKKQEIKLGLWVIDTWYEEYGIGVIQVVNKTNFTVSYPNRIEVYDYAHAKFLKKVDINELV